MQISLVSDTWNGVKRHLVTFSNYQLNSTTNRKYKAVFSTNKTSSGQFQLKTVGNFRDAQLENNGYTLRCAINASLWWYPQGYPGGCPWGLLTTSGVVQNEIWGEFANHVNLLYNSDNEAMTLMRGTQSEYMANYFSQYNQGSTVFYSLVQNGVKDITGWDISSDVQSNYNSSTYRSIFGKKKDGSLFIMVLQGVTGDRMVQACLDIDAQTAFNFDGGGSCCMYYDGTRVNDLISYLGGVERPVISALLVYEKDEPIPVVPTEEVPTIFVASENGFHNIKNAYVNVNGQAKKIKEIWARTMFGQQKVWYEKLFSNNFPQEYGTEYVWNTSGFVSTNNPYITTITSDSWHDGHGAYPTNALNGSTAYTNEWYSADSASMSMTITFKTKVKIGKIFISGAGMAHEAFANPQTVTILAGDSADALNYTLLNNQTTGFNSVDTGQETTLTLTNTRMFKVYKITLYNPNKNSDGYNGCVVHQIHFEDCYIEPIS